MTAPTSKGFDGKAELFRKRIYGSRKGVIRLQLLWEQLLRLVPDLQAGQPLQILDLGAGIGQMSAKLASLGHRLTLVDASDEMLALARAHFQEAGIAEEQARFICAGVGNMPALSPAQYDLVLCHAVLEWLQEPKQGLEVAASYVKEGGLLSLAYYNRHGLIYRNLLHGNFDRIRREHYAGDEGGFTPLHPLLPEELETWLAPLGLEPIYRAGLRTFSDFMPHRIAEKHSDDAILEMERRFAEQEPYRSLGRYQHLICVKRS